MQKKKEKHGDRIQPFGYTIYQRDEIAGTYYAQAREYWQRTAGLQGRI